ncbi:hypothetical protein EDB85DRAFT_1874196 [Lactarius pseudohatsudake]|nr:hypothetical protein EDB85DRAFT_1874196 [Lactarius pseudohatsudake]
MRGTCIVRVLLFFSFEYNDTYYPFALVEWFKSLSALVHRRWECLVVHLDSFFHAAHLIPVFGIHEVPKDFYFTYSLDTFNVYYVNKYIDTHTKEIAF